MHVIKIMLSKKIITFTTHRAFCIVFMINIKTKTHECTPKRAPHNPKI